LGEPITPAPLQAELTYSIDGVDAQGKTDVQGSSISNTGVQLRYPIAVAPAVSVKFLPDRIAVPVGRSRQDVLCAVHNYANRETQGTVRLNLPQGWSSEPQAAAFALRKPGQEAEITFHLILPATLPDAEYNVQAVVESNGRTYTSSFLPVTESDFPIVYMEEPARLALKPVNVIVPRLRIGYVVGTGDDVPRSLRLLGVDVDLLDADALSSRNLSRYDTIVLGVRAYLAREDLKAYNWRLLQYVKDGGVLLVQYNTEEFADNYGPYPYTAAGAVQDVTEEDSPIDVLHPEHPVLRFPNKIEPVDFNGWLEKRGLRFLVSWDERYVPILSTHDEGQQPQAGGLLVAHYGKGLWVYNGYSLYRQIDFAVPGSVRLFINMIALGAPDAPWRNSKQ
jgi:hypothetical protein